MFSLFLQIQMCTRKLLLDLGFWETERVALTLSSEHSGGKGPGFTILEAVWGWWCQRVHHHTQSRGGHLANPWHFSLEVGEEYLQIKLQFSLPNQEIRRNAENYQMPSWMHLLFSSRSETCIRSWIGPQPRSKSWGRIWSYWHLYKRTWDPIWARPIEEKEKL